MSVFIAKQLREQREKSGLSQKQVADRMQMSVRNLRRLELNELEASAYDIIYFAKLYKVDVRELLLESYVEQDEEQILFNRYASVFKLYDQLSDKDKEDIAWVLKQRIKGYI